MGYQIGAKTTVEEATKLSIFKLKEFGLLKGCCYSTLTWTRSLSGHKNSIGIVVNTNELYAKVNYINTNHHTDEKTDYDYKIQLATSRCNLGGVRYWFICPLRDCGRRTGTLFICSGGNYFGCRHCYDLAYESQHEPHCGRFAAMGAVLKADRQIEELHNKIKRWSYAGRPTKKARKIEILQQRITAYDKIWRTANINI
jgi:hypothetical protein